MHASGWRALISLFECLPVGSSQLSPADGLQEQLLFERSEPKPHSLHTWKWALAAGLLSPKSLPGLSEVFSLAAPYRNCGED